MVRLLSGWGLSVYKLLIAGVTQVEVRTIVALKWGFSINVDLTPIALNT